MCGDPLIRQASFVTYDGETEEVDSVRFCPHDNEVYTTSLSYMGAHEALRQYKTDKGFRDSWGQARTSMDDPDARPFKPQAVSQVVVAEASITKKYTVLNAVEYERVFGESPKVRETRWLTQASVPNHEGTGQETVYLFEYDHRLPFRTLEMKQALQTSKMQHLMTEAQHLWEGQGDKLLEWSAGVQLESWEVGLAKKQVRPLSYYLEKKHRSLESVGFDTVRPIAASSGRPTTAGDATHSEGEDASECDDDDDEDPDAHNESDERENSPPPSSHGKLGKGGKRPLLLAALSSSASKKPNPSPLKPNGAPAGSRPRSAAAKRAASASSIAGDGDPKAANAPPDETLAQSYIRKLNLVDSMVGGKLGVQRHHAEVLLQKLCNSGQSSSGEAKRLKHHLQLHALAESLQTDRISALESQELSTALEKLSTTVKIPDSVLVDVAAHNFHRELHLVSDNEGVNRVFDIAWPWKAFGTEADEKVDIRHPKLSQLSVEWSDKVKFVQKYLFNLFVDGLLEGLSPEKQDLGLALARTLVGRTEQVSTLIADLTEEQSAFLCEMSTIGNGLTALLDPPSIFVSEDAEALFTDLVALKDMKDTTAECKHTVAVALHDSPFLQGKLAVMTENQAAVMELRPVVVSVLEALRQAEGCVATDLAGKTDALEKALLVWPRLACGMNYEVIRFIHEDLLARIVSIGEGALCDGASLTIADLMMVNAFLVDAMKSMPADVVLPSLKSRVAAKVSSMQRQGNVESIMEVLQRMQTPEGAGAALDKLSHLLSTVLFENLGDEGMALMAKGVDNLVTFLSMNFLHSDTDKATDAISELVEILEPGVVTPRVPFAQCFVEARSMKRCHDAVQQQRNNRDGDQEGHGFLGVEPTTITELAVLLEKVRSNCEWHGSSEHLNEHDTKAFADMRALQQQCQLVLISYGEVHRSKLMAEADTLAAQLDQLKGGLADGGDWTDALEGYKNKVCEWEHFFGIAMNTIGKAKGVAGLKKPIDAYARVVRAWGAGRTRNSAHNSLYIPTSLATIRRVFLGHGLIANMSGGNHRPGVRTSVLAISLVLWVG